MAQQRQLGAKLVEQAGKAQLRGAVGAPDVRLTAACLDDQIDRTVLQMQPPLIGQKADLRGARHVRTPGPADGENI